MKTIRLAVTSLALAVTLVACGGDDGSPDNSSPTTPPTTSVEGTPAPPPEDTTPTTVAASSETCLTLASRGVRLLNSFRATMRGVAGPSPEDEAALRAEGQAILDEARALGCPIPAAVEQFLSGETVSG